LMQEMEPQRRLEWNIECAGDAELGGNLCTGSRRHNCREIHRHIELRLIELGLLHRQIRAHTLALRVSVAGDVRWLARMLVAMITVLVMATSDVRNFGDWRFIAAAQRFVRMMPAATQRRMNQQRNGNQAGENRVHQINLSGCLGHRPNHTSYESLPQSAV
jgi:hypothetical protein